MTPRADEAAGPRARRLRVRVQMAAAAVDGLRRDGFALYAFRAVATAGTAFPLVWRRAQALQREMDLEWTDALRVYACDVSIGEGVQMRGGGEYPVQAGQTLEVMQPGGRGPVEAYGAPGMVTVLNTTHHQLTCGLAAPLGDSFARSCALPLYPRHACVAAPVDRVLLAVAPANLPEGSVAVRAPAQSLLLDLSGGQERLVEYDRVRGWSWARGAGWARLHPAGENLVALLVERTPELREAREAALERIAREEGWRDGYVRAGGRHG